MCGEDIIRAEYKGMNYDSRVLCPTKCGRALPRDGVLWSPGENWELTGK
jgi:hypothetical protein